MVSNAVLDRINQLLEEIERLQDLNKRMLKVDRALDEEMQKMEGIDEWEIPERWSVNQ